MSEEFLTVYDLSVQEIPVEIGGTKYLLREPSESAATKYRNAAMRGAKMTDGSVQLGDAADVQAVLVSECLHELDKDGGVLRNVPVMIVKTWPARVVKPLFDKAMDMGGLREAKAKQDDDAKN